MSRRLFTGYNTILCTKAEHRSSISSMDFNLIARFDEGAAKGQKVF